MEKYESGYVDISITAYVQVPYRDEYDITNNTKELIEENLVVDSISDCVIIKDVKIEDIN